MMQAVTPSYSSQAYTQVQAASISPGQRISADNNSTVQPSNSPSSQQQTGDPVSLSEEGQQRSQNQIQSQKADGDKDQNESAKNNSTTPGEESLSQEDLKLISDLQKRDAEVRAHEQAHLSAAGQYASGGASFSYTTGPNGKRYASGGEVPIDIGKERTPDATIQKMRTIQRAALAPANPSSTDRRVAAQASAMETQAMKELQELTQKTSSSILSSNYSAAGTQEDDQSSSSRKNTTTQNSPPTPQVSSASHATMTAAYQAMASLAP